MEGDTWVLVEHWRGRVTETTFETLALGRELADSLGGRLVAVLLGHQCASLAAQLAAADGVLCGEHDALAEPSPESYAEALHQLSSARSPAAVLIPLTNVTLGIGTLLGARLGLPAVNFCKDLRVSGGNLEATCTIYGGKMEAVVAIRRQPAVLGIWPGVRPVDKGRLTGAPPVENVPVTLPQPQARFRRYLEPEAGDIDISQVECLVAVGRGIQDKQNLAVAEELAASLGGAVCGSRPVIDQGWLPLSRQVGKSGANVKARLYIAAGISGAPEHVEGIRQAGTIVAVNTDPHAPIFSFAHYGIVADAIEFLPAFTEAVRKRKQGA